jgi:hypothetical protein
MDKMNKKDEEQNVRSKLNCLCHFRPPAWGLDVG